MSKPFMPDNYRSALTRRDVLAGAGGVAGLAAGMGAHAGSHSSLDLDDPEGNLTALIKLQADISGKDALGGFSGEVWGWVPGGSNRNATLTVSIS